ncbi:MAG: hypothetical protein AVDCRST_MAG49-2438 [uncultured Thermomicrobiales bacterium]|uniref:Uncharacterized protein n=1 Tax=uncultured Thermomicrobiales bacterium TaxID=1645740 RepID=A0A6J4V0C4_9BACT|nr:MAG: hypothetical protein AVDCRST_MAG49-2438 [uncultured Thermomicrobiales bacterium]
MGRPGRLLSALCRYHALPVGLFEIPVPVDSYGIRPIAVSVTRLVRGRLHPALLLNMGLAPGGLGRRRAPDTTL